MHKIVPIYIVFESSIMKQQSAKDFIAFSCSTVGLYKNFRLICCDKSLISISVRKKSHNTMSMFRIKCFI